MRDGEQQTDLARLLAELNAKAETEEQPSELAPRLPVRAIKRLPELFQQRDGEENESHIQELGRALKDGRMLDPVVVIQVGSAAYLIDGHHRCTAYVRAKVSAPVPVRYFRGSLEDAVIESGRANSKAKLPMTTEEKQNTAWRLVRERTADDWTFTRKQVIEAASVSRTQVGHMRTVRLKLGEEALKHDRWLSAMKASKGEQPEFTDEERKEWIEKMAKDYASRMQREFGNKLKENPEIAALALEEYFGMRWRDVWDYLGPPEEIGEGDSYEEEDDEPTAF